MPSWKRWSRSSGTLPSPQSPPRLMAAGAQIALGADDPLLFGSRLLDQYETARRIGLDAAELAGLAASSIRLSAAPAPVRSRLLDGVRDWLGSPAP